MHRQPAWRRFQQLDLAAPRPARPHAEPPTAPLKNHKAAFFVATHHRPEWLRLCLQRLVAQQVPRGWVVEILVAGQPHDPGKQIVHAFPGVRYIEVSRSSSVTSKENACLQATDAVLVMLADDDDLQPLNRAEAAIRAHEEGFGWAGSGACWFYDTAQRTLVQWVGAAEQALIGTSLSYNTEILRAVGGWPETSRGKDGAIARLIKALPNKPRFKNLTGEIGAGLVCLQHGQNLWNRPALAEGETRRYNGFALTGFAPSTIRGLDRLGQPRKPETPTPASGKPVQGSRIRVALTSYERPQEVLLTLMDIEREGAGQDVHVVLYDDASTRSYQGVRDFLRERGWTYIPVARHGKRGYLRLMLRVLADARRAGAQYNYFIQDDIRLCRKFFSKTIDLWESVSDAHKATLFLLVDGDRGAGGVAPWTGCKAVPRGAVNLTQWVDGNAFMFGSGLFNGLADGCPAPPKEWFLDPTHGSGFGRQVSRTLHERGYSLYQTARSYVVHAHLSSTMNPEARAAVMLLTRAYVDGDQSLNEKLAEIRVLAGDRVGTVEVFAGLATIPSRRDCLHQVVQRLLPQVSHLGVYLNGYPEVPEFLSDPKIRVVRSQDQGDRGDAGKFYWVGQTDGYYFSCDDDLSYPRDYVQWLLREIERFNRKAVVGVHGVLVREPFVSYYKSRKVIHFNHPSANATPVHILGTGTTAFHTSTLRVTTQDFRHPNMADVWLGILGQQQGVPFLSIQRPGNWLTDLGSSDSIFRHSKQHSGTMLDSAGRQTEEVRRHLPWTLPRPAGWIGRWPV